MLTLISVFTLFLTPCLSLEIVKTRLGQIRGHYKKSFENKTFLAFEGIPYAEPPIGDKRFEAPEPIEKWDGIWDATSLHQCVQIENQKISGDEDCLYLNVYVPRLHVNTSERLDVIVHIHGGAFLYGSGHVYAFPGYLMDSDVIFVTFNYRLGIFGFLSTEDDAIPGNNGLKDQVLALKWVKDHIANFGGDPNSVTITGASAGAACVHLHYFSPLSRGLFHRGLSQSGCALNPWAVRKGALDKAKILALAVGCPHETSQVLKNCLKQRTYWQILTQMNLFYEIKEFPPGPFGPVVEKVKGAFLSKEPEELLKLGQVQDVPWIVAFVPHEGNILISDFQYNIEDLDLNWNKYAPFILIYNDTVPKNQWGNVAKKVKNYYLEKDQMFTQDNFKNFVKLVSDRLMIDGFFRSVDLQANVTNASVYLYELSYTGKKNIVDHADDNQYFFYNSSGTTPTQEEIKIKNIMVKMLVTYATSGKPKIDRIVWKPVKSDEISFVNISGFESEDIKLETNQNVANGEFWTSLNLD